MRIICFAIVLVFLGCGNEPPLPKPVAPVDLSTVPVEVDFDSMLVECRKVLLETQASNQEWGLGTFDRWSVDQLEGTIVFSSKNGHKAEAPVQIIGSFSSKDNSWLWAWGNSSIKAPIKTGSLKIKEYGKKHGIEKLITRKWIGTEKDAWDMAAIALNILKAKGVYRGPGSSSNTFMTFGEVKITKPKDGS